MSAGYLGLGSNVGDRLGHLRAAVDRLTEQGVEVVRERELADIDGEEEPEGEA